MSIKDTINQYIILIDQALSEALSGANVPDALREAMHYSVFPGGKRLRPVLALASAHAVGGRPEVALPPAVAFELIHCCSLVHDDLPCMDDDDMRRGKPSCHKKFGEAMAVLTGDALMTLAFEVLAQAAAGSQPEQGKRLSSASLEVAKAAGPAGMIGGQVLDIDPEQDITVDNLDSINKMKTGALIAGSVRAGAIVGGADYEQKKALDVYGQELGRAFQICDDILDVDIDKDEPGNPGYPAVIGLEQSRQIAADCIQHAQQVLEAFDNRGQFLSELAQLMLDRTS